MRYDLLLGHLEQTQTDGLTRRAVLRAGGTAAALAALTAAGAGAAGPAAASHTSRVRPRDDDRAYDDVMFDVGAVERGAWAPGPYGPTDERGSFNEVTPLRTARALQLVAGAKDVRTYSLGEQMFNGFPAFTVSPPRSYDQTLTVLGYKPAPGFVESGGIVMQEAPFGANKLSFHEERLGTGATYQIGTQVDNLNHIGVGTTYYNGFQGPEIARDYGTTRLGAEKMGPIVTRGVLLDILGLVVESGHTADWFRAPNGKPVLRVDYRITVEDIRAAMARGGIKEIEPGDVVLFRTGWNQLLRTDSAKWLSGEPGIYLREARWLAARKPALVGGDTWGLEVLAGEVTKGNAFPVHQELIVKHGIRIGESLWLDGLARDRVYEFVYMVSPVNALGATASNTPPVALARPKRKK